MRKIWLFSVGLVGVAFMSALAQVAPPATPLPTASAALDEGRLDPAWFGVGLEFRRTNELDYLWVKPGFSIVDRKVRFVPFGEVQVRGPDPSKRDEKDLALARRLNPTLHEELAAKFHAAFGKHLAVVQEGEDVRVEGRIVDCAESAWRKGFSFKKIYSLTVDMKVVDAATGGTVVAIHHRTVSNDWSDWAEEMAEEVQDEGFAKLYAKGKPVRK
ncbi:MAG: hypothetical protein LAO05_12015 [Acidobacteriia bacterium]|nr:hypothetical protein [Terriglobia bacterium]